MLYYVQMHMFSSMFSVKSLKCFKVTSYYIVKKTQNYKSDMQQKISVIKTGIFLIYFYISRSECKLSDFWSVNKKTVRAFLMDLVGLGIRSFSREYCGSALHLNWNRCQICGIQSILELYRDTWKKKKSLVKPWNDKF